MGLFDDLIPTTRSGGLFDDLIPADGGDQVSRAATRPPEPERRSAPEAHSYPNASDYDPEQVGQPYEPERTPTPRPFSPETQALMGNGKLDALNARIDASRPPITVENAGSFAEASRQRNAQLAQPGSISVSGYDFDTRAAHKDDNALERGAAKGLVNLQQQGLGLRRFYGELTGDDALSSEMAKEGARMARMDTAVGEGNTAFEKNVVGATSSIVSQLPGLAAGVLSGGATLPLAGMFVGTFGQEYEHGRSSGKTVGEATTRAGLYGAAEVLGEAYGIGPTMKAVLGAAKGVPTKELSAQLAKMFLAELPGEQATTLMQFLTDKSGRIGLSPEATFSDYLEQAGQTLTQTITQSAMMGGGLHGVRLARGAGAAHGTALAEADAEAAKTAALAKAANLFNAPPPGPNAPPPGPNAPPPGPTQVGVNPVTDASSVPTPAPVGDWPIAPALPGEQPAAPTAPQSEPTVPLLPSPGLTGPGAQNGPNIAVGTPLPVTEAPATPAATEGELNAYRIEQARSAEEARQAALAPHQIEIDPANPSASIAAIAAAPLPTVAPELTTPSGLDEKTHADASGRLADTLAQIHALRKSEVLTPTKERPALKKQIAELEDDARAFKAAYGSTHGEAAATQMHTVAARTAGAIRGDYKGFVKQDTSKPVQEKPVSTEREQPKKVNENASPVRSDAGQVREGGPGGQSGVQRGAVEGRSDLQQQASQAPNGLEGDHQRGTVTQEVSEHVRADGTQIAKYERDIKANPLQRGERVMASDILTPVKDRKPTSARVPVTREQITKDADAIAAMSDDVRDNTEIGDFPGHGAAYDLYEGRKMAPKPSEKLRRLNDVNSFSLHQSYDFVANVDGRVYGVNKREDPDANEDDDYETGTHILSYTPLDEPHGKEVSTHTSDHKELIAAIRENGATEKKAVSIDDIAWHIGDDGKLVKPKGKIRSFGVLASSTKRGATSTADLSASGPHRALLLRPLQGEFRDALDGRPRDLSERERMLISAVIRDARKSGLPDVAISGLGSFHAYIPVDAQEDARWYIAANGETTIGFREDMLKNALDGHAPSLAALQHYFMHEVGHELDSAPAVSDNQASHKSPLFAIRNTPGGRVAEGEIMFEVMTAYRTSLNPDLIHFLAYPLDSWGLTPKAAGRASEAKLNEHLQEEVFAQLHSLWYNHRALLMKELPQSYMLMKELHAELDKIAASPSADREVAQAIHRTLRTSLDDAVDVNGPGTGGETRARFGEREADSGVDIEAVDRLQRLLGAKRKAPPGLKPDILTPVSDRAEKARDRKVAKSTDSDALSYRKNDEKPLGKKSVEVDDVGRHFDKLIADEFGGPLDYNNPVHVARAVELMRKEFAYQLTQARSGLDWYSEDIKGAFEMTATIIPELHNELHRQLFGVTTALMSPGTKAHDNWNYGAIAYKIFTETGTIPETKPADMGGELWGVYGATTAKAIGQLNSMIEEMGRGPATEWLMSHHTVQEINRVKHKYGNYKDAPVDGKMLDLQLGVYMFGEKVGPFALNVLGIDTEVTVDVWLTRTFNRMFGTMFHETGKHKGEMRGSPSEPERRVIKGMIESVAKSEGYSNSQVQAVLWFFEQGVYTQLGAASPSMTFSDGARDFLAYNGDTNEDGSRDGSSGERAAETEAGAGDNEVASQATLADFAKGKVESLLSKDGWVVMTADLASAKPVDNKRAGRQLENDLREMGITDYQKVVGRYGSGDENSLVVTGITPAQADSLRDKYGQDSYLDRRGFVHSDGTVTPAKSITAQPDAASDFYTIMPSGFKWAADMDFDARGEPDAELEARFPRGMAARSMNERLYGLPASSPGPNEEAHTVAARYTEQAGIIYSPPTTYVKVDPAYSKKIADAYEKMEHAPDDPDVKAAYRAMIDETVEQWDAIMKTGLKVDFTSDENPYPYKSPMDAVRDVRDNNHLTVFATEEGFGPGDRSDNPLLAKTGIKVGGKELVANDVFRAVHDYFGHVKDGVGFRADGEENAWRSHASMYTPLARRAMTTETRGQNSWVNYGPHGETNRTAKNDDTIYADQKAGLLPEEFSEDRYEKPRAPRGMSARAVQAINAPPANPASWSAPEASRMDNFIHAMQDKHVDTKRVVQAIVANTQAIHDSVDVYLQEELFHGRAAKQTSDFLDRELKPLIADMAARGVTIPDFEEYLHNRHAEERNVQIAKVNPKYPDGGSGIDTADARAYLSGLPSDKRMKYDALARRVDAMLAKTAALKVSGRLESQDTIDAWNGAYSAYVPLHREDMDAGGPGTGQGYSVKGKSKRATGSSKAVENILGHIALDRESTITRAEKNRIANALVALAAGNPNKDFWEVDKPPQRTYIAQNGLAVTTVDPTFKQHDNVVVARMLDANGDIVERAVIFNKHDERAMRMSQSIKNVDAEQLHGAVKFAAGVTRYFAAINTQYNPIFGVVNLTRDVGSGMFNLSTTAIKGQQGKVLRRTLPALAGIFSDLRAHRRGQPRGGGVYGAAFEQMQDIGGQTGYRDLFVTGEDRANAIKREMERAQGGGPQMFIETFRWLGGMISDYNTAMENAVRVSAFMAAKESGLTDARSGSLAKNLTVNFNRKGAKTLNAGALYAFFNASVQGNARIIETLKGPQGLKILLGGVTFGVLQAMALAAAGFDDDEPPEFVKERNIIIPVGGKKYLTIPMPQGLLIIPNLGRIPAEFVLSGFRKPGEKVRSLFSLALDSFSPMGGGSSWSQMLTPTIFDPIVALGQNEDWTGKPIAREDMNPLAPTPGPVRAREGATPFSKMMSEAANKATGGTDFTPGALSPTPDQIDYLIGQFTGGVGREIGKVATTVAGTATGEEVPSHRIPLVGRFYGDANQQTGQSAKFYENLKEINGHEAEIKGRKEAKEDWIEYRDANPTAVLVDKANAVEREVSKLRKAKRTALADGAERDTIKGFEEKITDKMRDFNELVKETR